MRLRGLTVDEVHRMYEAVRGQGVPWGQAEAVFRATEGNPLFVQEVLRYLVEEGVVVREGGRYVTQQGEGVGIPEGLRDVVGKRLNRLGEKTTQVLSIAAGIGRDFRLDVLQAVKNVNGPVSAALFGMDANNQSAVDAAMIGLDGTPDKSALGGNAIVAVSLACLHAAAADAGVPLWKHLAGEGTGTVCLPVPDSVGDGQSSTPFARAFHPSTAASVSR